MTKIYKMSDDSLPRWDASKPYLCVVREIFGVWNGQDWLSLMEDLCCYIVGCVQWHVVVCVFESAHHDCNDPARGWVGSWGGRTWEVVTAVNVV